MRNNSIAAVACVFGATLAWGYMRNANAQTDSAAKMKQTTTTSKVAKVTKSDAEWKKILTPEQYDVMRQKGTERAFTGKYWHNEETGAYYCAACGLELFTSKTKFEFGNGLAEFLSGSGQGQRDYAHGCGRRAHRSDLRPLRQSFGPRFHRRPQAHRPALLHEFRQPGVQKGRRQEQTESPRPPASNHNHHEKVACIYCGLAAILPAASRFHAK